MSFTRPHSDGDDSSSANSEPASAGHARAHSKILSVVPLHLHSFSDGAGQPSGDPDSLGVPQILDGNIVWESDLPTRWFEETTRAAGRIARWLGRSSQRHSDETENVIARWTPNLHVPVALLPPDIPRLLAGRRFVLVTGGTVERGGGQYQLEGLLRPPVTREQAALRIRPETADVWFDYRQILDPYGERSVSEEEFCVGRVFFAADPTDGVPVCFYDLPAAIREALEDRRAQEDAKGWRDIISALDDFQTASHDERTAQLAAAHERVHGRDDTEAETSARLRRESDRYFEQLRCAGDA